jgi:hypothetical protein
MEDAQTPAWLKTVLKHWARSVPGRFAMTYQQWEIFGETDRLDWRRWTHMPADPARHRDMMQIGRDIFESLGPAEYGESMPMVTGFIMAVARVRLWTLMTELPADAVLYIDTDSLMCTDRHHDAVREVAQRHPQWGLRLKKSWDGFAIWGPRQIVTGPQVRVAGIPVHATRTGRHQFEGQVWESLETAIRKGRFAAVRIMPRAWTVRGVDNRRQDRGVGWTTPQEIDTRRMNATQESQGLG